ncbi:MAG: hypothetical protein A3J83_06565 [Elusimicrobia bacterium RIFOXYA2_FULL_40_6]|nr:MAG: hypothetical protein A3J83_06565 [Elusimicrobia bacterium RIFOXYA2_FULL_40_6]
MAFAELKTNASLELKVINDSNIYYEKNDPQSSMITSFIPGLNFLAVNNQNKLALDYSADIMNYSYSPSTNNATNQTINALIDMTFPVGLSLKFRDTYKDTSDAPSSELVKRIKRTQNTIAGDVGYKINRLFSADIVLNQTKHDYSQAEYKPLYNRLESETGLIVFYGVSPKTSALLEYGSGKIAYDDENNLNDSTYSNIKLGLKGALTPKTVGIFKVGSQSRKYDFYTVNTSTDFSTIVLSLTSKTDFSKMTSLSLTINRDIQESVFLNNLYYLSTGLSAELNQKIGSSWATIVSARYEMGDYPNTTVAGVAKRADTNNVMGIAFQYSTMEWLSASIGFSSKSRSSNYTDLNYTDTVTNLGIKAIF